MISATDLESGRGAHAAPPAGEFCSLYFHYCPLGVLMNHDEGVIAGDSVLPASEARPVVLQAETMDRTSFSACGCVPSRVLRPFTPTRHGGNADHSQRNVSGQGSSQARAQTRAYFLYCRDIIGLTDTKSITAIIRLLTLSLQHQLRPRI